MPKTTSQAVDPKIAQCWKDHLESHNTSSITAMAATYTDDCYISYYNTATGVKKEFKGIEGKLAFAEEHLNSNKNYDGSATTDMVVNNYFNGDTLFNQWNIKSEHYSYKDGCDVFVFGGPDKLITHQYQWYFGTKFTKDFESPEDCFKAHHNFVVSGDVLGVVNTFTEDCAISFFNLATNTRQEVNGHEQAKAFYKAFLKLIHGHEVVEAPVTNATVDTSEIKAENNTLAFCYSVETAGILKSNDTFVFSGEKDNKIKNLWVCYEGPTIEWSNL